MLIGLISGSGTEHWPGLEHEQQRTAETAYGPVELVTGRVGEVDVVHLSRHGPSHHRLSNHVGHKANLSALLAAKADAVIGCTVCGAVDPSVTPGSLVVFDDLYFPSNRLPDGSLCTWHNEAGGTGRGHWIFDRPFSEPLRRVLVRAGEGLDAALVDGGTYGYVDGPRFNTRAEIAALARVGVSALSQTAGPEAVLAGEAGLPYALVGFVTDYANGVADEPDTLKVLLARVARSGDGFASLVAAALPQLSPDDLAPAGMVHRVDP
ncbi:MAG: MTAP family purine nucleoside phosphorylase [Deltaproteobacteria bacterium]